MKDQVTICWRRWVRSGTGGNPDKSWHLYPREGREGWRIRSPSAGEDEFIVEQVGTLTKAKLYAPGRGGWGEGSGHHLLEKMSSQWNRWKPWQKLTFIPQGGEGGVKNQVTICRRRWVHSGTGGNPDKSWHLYPRKGRVGWRIRSPSAGEDEFVVEQVETLTKVDIYTPGRGGWDEESGHHLQEKMSS